MPIPTSLDVALAADGCKHRVSLMTYLATWNRAPRNIETLLSTDRRHFQKSKFSTSAYEYRPYEPSDERHSIRMRLYPSSHKVLITGVRSLRECIDACDALSLCVGDMEFDPPECQLININIALPFSLKHIVDVVINHVSNPAVRFVERQESHPAIIVHVDTSERIRKVLVYPKSGKVSLHVSSFDEAHRIWNIMKPSLVESRGFPIQL